MGVDAINAAELARGLHEAGVAPVAIVLVIVILLLSVLLMLVVRLPARVIGEELLVQLGEQQGAFFERIQAEAKDAHDKADKAERKAEQAERTAERLSRQHAECVEAHLACTRRVEEMQRQLADALNLRGGLVG